MNRTREILDNIRPVPVIGTAIVLGLATYLVTNPPKEAKTKDGITFERDGTAISGTESGKGWLDLVCSEGGELTIRVVNPQWQTLSEGQFATKACDDTKLEAGEITRDDIPENLRG